MISMVLGLLVVGAAIGIFLSNRQAYAATEGVGRIQETARLGFELIARDIREAG
ncbi:pilus assembly protein PilW, partial [Xanthomonas perforans]